MIKLMLQGLFLSAALVMPAAGIIASELKERDAAYLDQVVGVLRSHVTAMQMILDDPNLKYADNMLRHAEALERAFGMVGPMDWHAAEAYRHVSETEQAQKLTEQQFEILAEESQIALNRIKRAAKRYARDKNSELMRASLSHMMTTCGACHSKLPKGTVPSVWKGLKD